MEKYSMGSFGDAKELMELGLEEGRKLYPRFKALADSLNAIYGPPVPKVNRLPQVHGVVISSYEVHGTDRTSAEFFVHTMNFETNTFYTARRLANMVRQAYGTRYYSRVTYSLEPQTDGTSKIIFDVTEYPLTFAKLGLHYNRFTGVGLIANLTARNFFTANSRSLVTVNIGETFRIRGEHLQYLGPPEECGHDPGNAVRQFRHWYLYRVEAGRLVQPQLLQIRQQTAVLGQATVYRGCRRPS